MSHIPRQLAGIKERIATAAEAAGRAPGDVTLVAVSKTFPASDIQTAYDSGQIVFGENRIHELTEKVPALPSDIQWHMIGHLQSNKAARAVELADYIHSVDTTKLVNRLDRYAGELGKAPKILLEINVSRESTKFGADDSEVMSLAEAAVACRNIQTVGLMTMAPFGASEYELRTVFSGLRKLRDWIQVETGLLLPELSMGMSGDFEAAIAEGATLVRIGSAIFGNRDYQ
jgi:PLP dependent protein